MTKAPNITRSIPMGSDHVQAESWMESIRQEEAKALSELHQIMIERMKQKAGATITSTLDSDMPDPETGEQEDIVEDEAAYRIEFPDGSAIVLGTEVWGYTIMLGIHSSRLPDDDPFQGFRYVDKEGELYGQHLPKEAVN